MGKVAHVGISKSRGTDHDAFEQRMEAQYRRWLSEVADRARELCSERGLAALFLVGSERLVEPIAASLPREIQPRVVMIEEDLGGIVSPVLEERVEPAIAQWERSQESDAVSALLDDAHGATTGIDATLAELQRGGVRILMVAEGVNTTLSQCTRCGWADRSDDSVCSACGSVKQTVDLREALPELAWNHGAEFEIVRGDASTRLIEAGGMGGWLRQPKPAALKRPAARAS